jgi:DNA-binding transcriptional LysR family regulator
LGLGVGFLPAHRIQDLLKQGSLVALPLEEPVPALELYIAWKTSNKGKILRWFIKQLSQPTNYL